MSAHGTSTEEELEVVKFFENNAPFAILLGKNWIEKDHIRRKQEEEDLEQKKKELRNFMARRIVHILEEQEDKLKLLRTRDRVVEFERTREYLKHLSIQENIAPTPKREEVLPLNNLQQCKVTMLSTDNNKNGKRNPVTQITRNKSINLSKKKARLEKLQEVLERTLQKEGLHNLNFVGIVEQQRFSLHHSEAI
jgi:hypothetical protein